jgi:transposase
MAQAAQAGSSEAVTRRGPRRRHSIAQKLAIIRECLQPGASLAGVALAHRVNANMVRKWVVKYQQGGYGEFAEGAMLPVVVRSQRVKRVSPGKPGAIATVEVELRRGILRIHNADASLLNALVVALSA